MRERELASRQYKASILLFAADIGMALGAWFPEARLAGCELRLNGFGAVGLDLPRPLAKLR